MGYCRFCCTCWSWSFAGPAVRSANSRLLVCSPAGQALCCGSQGAGYGGVWGPAPGQVEGPASHCLVDGLIRQLDQFLYTTLRGSRIHASTIPAFSLPCVFVELLFKSQHLACNVLLLVFCCNQLSAEAPFLFGGLSATVCCNLVASGTTGVQSSCLTRCNMRASYMQACALIPWRLAMQVNLQCVTKGCAAAQWLH